MEISRKKITNAEIHAKEKEITASVGALTEGFSEGFGAIGYVLETEISRDNENLDAEKVKLLRESPIEEEAEYSDGYISSVKITVKRAKTEEELAAEAAEALEDEEAREAMKLDADSASLSEEAIQAENDKKLEKAKRELERSVAFTSMFIVRIYKTFWKETVSISEGTDEMKEDLEEFLSVLTKKAQEAENQ